jgi:hypothetical protein
MMAKRQKQAEYARDLEQQMQQHEYQKMMEKQQRMGQQQQTYESEKNQDRDLKRQKQSEYNLALQQQILTGMQKNKVVVDNYQPEPPRNTNAAQWVIGPLGVPVRKTLEVGNRGLQKVFNQSPSKAQVSPTKVANYVNPAMDGFNKMNFDYMDPYNRQDAFNPNGPQGFYPNEIPQVALNGLQPMQALGGGLPLQPNMQFGVGLNSNQMNAQLDMVFYILLIISSYYNYYQGGGLIDVQSEREAKKKRLQEEHQYALEQQIAQKKAILMEEKMKKDQEERLEAKRLEEERLQIQLAFEKEQQAARIKKDEENKTALLIQAEV